LNFGFILLKGLPKGVDVKEEELAPDDEVPF